MTLPHLDAFFADLGNLDITQPYDAKADGDDALAAFHAQVLAQLEGDEEAREDLADWAQSLAHDMDAILQDYVAALMPSEIATDSSDYFVQTETGYPVSVQDQISALQDGPPEGSSVPLQLGLSNTPLEQTFQALLDHLSAKRIHEEMDTATYIERLRGAFQRTRDGARDQADKLAKDTPKIETIIGRTSIIQRIVDILLQDVLPERGEESTALERSLSDLAQFTTRTSAFGQHVLQFATLSTDSLTRVHRDFATTANMAGAEGESILVSREIERHALFRPLPLVWALIITLLVKIVLAHNTSETLHYMAVALLVLSFVLTWVLSIYIGIKARKSRMKTLQNHTRMQLRQVLRCNTADKDIVEFPRLGPDAVVAPAQRLYPFHFRGNTARHKRSVFARNLLALMIPALLLGLVLITRDRTENDFVARFDTAQPCVLVRGHLVFATRNAYFVKPAQTTQTPAMWLLDRVFPELTAEVVERGDVIRLYPDLTDRTERPADCATPSPIAVTPQPISGTELTVNLGASSLDVLAKAIAAGGTPPPTSNDPVIMQALALITLELSKPDITQIDASVFLQALETVRNQIDVDLSLADALTLALGLEANSTTTLDMPPAFLAILEGDQGLPAELRALRIALEQSNSIAADIRTQATLNWDSDQIVAVLNDGLTALVRQAQSLEANIALALDARAEGAVIVTPAFFAPPETDADIDPVLAQIFQTTIRLEDRDDVVETVSNTLVLPFFTAPVETGDGALETEQGAFDWGANVDYLIDPPVTADQTTYFDRIAGTLDRCLADNATVEIDVIGLASSSWDGSVGQTTRGALNYHLAEGRRIGALRKVASFMDPANYNRIFVQTASGPPAKLSDILSFVDRSGDADDVLSQFGRFMDQQGFETRREDLLAVSGLNPDVKSPLEELFARSVVLRMVRTDGGPCQF